MTDAEFWECMAISVEAAQTMPDHFNGERCKGLCSLLHSALLIGLVGDEQSNELRTQIEKFRPKKSGLYFWKPGAWRPRVKAMYKLAALARKEGE